MSAEVGSKNVPIMGHYKVLWKTYTGGTMSPSEWYTESVRADKGA